MLGVKPFYMCSSNLPEAIVDGAENVCCRSKVADRHVEEPCHNLLAIHHSHQNSKLLISLSVRSLIHHQPKLAISEHVYQFGVELRAKDF